MIYKIWCRSFQFVMKLGSCFMGYRMPEYLSGPGSVRRLPELMREKGAGKALVVTGPNISRLGLTDGFFKSLDEMGMEYVLFNSVFPNPTDIDVEHGLELYRNNGCGCIVAFGGGSPMDCAKAIAARVVRPGKTVSQLQGVLKVRRRIPPFFAIPTTAGTGSETTVAAVITDSSTHRKASINDPSLLPRYAVLDPELTLGLPPHTTAITGMDALCHAVESYLNHSYNTPLEDELAKKAVGLINDCLLRAYNNGDDLQARQGMQMAAFYAGRSFTRGCVGYVHALGHAVSGLYGTAHGLAMAVIMPHVFRRYGRHAQRRLAELADVISLKGENEAEKAAAFIDWIDTLNEKMGIPATLDNIKDEDIPQMISWALREANPLYPVPQIWGEEDMRLLIRDIRG